VKQGLNRELAYKLAAQTMVGSGKMVLQTGTHPGALKDSVCSPGGSTIAGIYTLEQRGLRGIMMEAVDATILQCREMGEAKYCTGKE
ncbi:Pyrroline-5-carboxylate reductase, partial [Caligus rogercresseyi]